MSHLEPPRVLAIIPARGGSKGLPGKNVRPLAGKPLIGHAIAAAAMVPQITQCVVSTDSPEIQAVAAAEGGYAPFLRPSELATDWTPMPPVLRHALASVEAGEGKPFDLVVLMDPTSPARRPEWISEAVIRLQRQPHLDGIISVSQPAFNPLWVGVKSDLTDDTTLVRYFPQAKGITRRQDASRYLRINGNFYVWRRDFILRAGDSWFDEGKHGFLEIPDTWAFAIDYESEFLVLEALVHSGLIKLPWMNPE